MMQLTTAQSSSTAPCYIDPLSRTIGVLQHLQVLLPPSATLDDVQRLVFTIQNRFGEHTTLENVIQSLVGQHLLCQLSARRRAATLPVRQEVAV